MSLSKPVPGKAQGANPVASDAKKKRKLPDFGHEESTLTETTTRNVVEQYLKQRPERLGTLLGRLDRKDRVAALESIKQSEILKLNETYESLLAPTDRIAILNYHDSAVDMDYALLQVSELPDDVSGVLSHWFNDWIKDYNTAAKRSGHIEHDGSAQLETDSELDSLSDAIEAYAADLREAQENEEEEEEGEEFDMYQKMEELGDTLNQFFENAEWVKIEPQEKRSVFMFTPKITIRFESQ